MPTSVDLPSRYVAGLDRLHRARFDEAIEGVLKPGMSVLDAGSGRTPAVGPTRRPPRVHYVGFDIDKGELDAAPEMAYDERRVGDVTQFVPELAGRFDVVLSMFLLEHVRPLDAALENMRTYLKPGGVMIAQLAGGRSPAALLNRAIPHGAARVALRLVDGLRRSSSQGAFPSEYDRCTYHELAAMMRRWTSAEITPQHTGAIYFSFSSIVLKAYLALEQQTLRRPDGATWYLIVATR